MEIESKSASYYWVIIIILVLALCWSKYKSNVEDVEEHFESQEKDLELNTLLGLLLDNQTIANQIIIDNPKIKSITTLVNLNQDRIRLKLKPILKNDQYQIILRYLLLKDVYFIDANPNEYINYARNPQILNPKELYNSSSIQETQLNKFRQQYHLEKDKYLKYNWVIDKIQDYITQYGFRKVSKSFSNLKTVFDNYWEGLKELTKRDLTSLPEYITIYNPTSEKYYIKIKDNQWYSWSETNTKTNIKLIQKIQLNDFDKWFDILKTSADKDILELPPNDFYIWIRSSSIMSLQQLYRKLDELNNDNYFELAFYYDQMINNNSVNKSTRSKLLKNWIENKTSNAVFQKFIIENIIIDLNHQVLQVFDDLCVYLIFYQYTSIMDLHLETSQTENVSLSVWWSEPDLDKLLIRSTKLDQCYLPAKFSMTQVQESPPLFKYVFNNNLYHTFWEPLEIYISQLEEVLKNTFRTKDINKIAPIARFCIFNNPSFREFISKYIHCTKDKCSVNVVLSESEKCGQLKLKYQELLSLKQKYKCLYTSKTSENPLQKQKENFLSLQDNQKLDQTFTEKTFTEKTFTWEVDENETKVNQMMGFGKVILLDIVEYATKLHKCQIDTINMDDCQDLSLNIDTEDQPTDQNLKEVKVDHQPDMYSIYDQQLEQYHKILHNQETKTLAPLNILANKDLKEKQKQTSITNNLLRTTADDFYSIISDLTNLPKENFNNFSEDDTDASFEDYTKKIEKQLQGYDMTNAYGFIDYAKNISVNLWDILTKDGRMMTSGFIIMILALSLYFIDITS